jgi:DNA polymerase III subunit beta
MIINVHRDQLLEKITLASHFSTSRLSSLVSLQGVLLQGEKDLLHFYSTNLSTYFHSQIKIENDEKFSIIIDQKKVLEFLNLLKPEKIKVSIKEDTVTFEQEKTKGSFPLIKQEDFPLPPAIKEKGQKIPTSFLLKNLPLVLFTASKDESRPALSAVNFLVMDGKLTLVSTDGFRLSLLKQEATEAFPNMLIPADFLGEVVRQTKDEKEVFFAYSQSEKTIVFKTSENEFFSRLVEGEFPPFEKVIPTESKTTVVLDREEFIRGIKLISVFARDFSNIVICEFKKGELLLHPKTGAETNNSTSQEIELKGEEQKIAFNFRFVLDFLNNIDAKKINIDILRSDAPVVFHLEDKKNFLHVIMPVRIQE